MINNIFGVVLLCIVCGCPTLLKAQVTGEQVVPLGVNAALQNSSQSNNSFKRAQRADTSAISLPFVDDFSYKSIFPSADLWLDSQAVVGNNFQINHTSYGAATLDGLRQDGLPYNYKGINENFGGADTLTSRRINLQNKTEADSIFLSFFYQLQGLGDYPNEQDTLFLEFKRTNVWTTVWSSAGSDMAIVDPIYRYFNFFIQEPVYLDSLFQFRFRNLASITGNNDHWHLNYVFLDEDRGFNTEASRDLAIKDPATNFLSDYTSMPWRQFAANRAGELADSFDLSFRNNGTFPLDMGFGYTFEDDIAGTTFDQSQAGLTVPGFQGNGDDIRTFSAEAMLTYTPAATDSAVICLNTRINFEPGNITAQNDTVCNCTEFYNYLAYDDGTPEKGYGLQGPGIKQFAYRFDLNEPDTLRGIYIHFTSIDSDVEGMLLDIVAWRSIDAGNTGVEDDTLAFLPQQEIYFRQDGRYGFSLYEFETPIPVSDSFYVGFVQTDQRNTQVGLDVSKANNDKMFVFANQVWSQSSVEATPMIRAVLGPTDIDLPASIVEYGATEEQTLLVYPNPVRSELSIGNGVQDQVYVFDLNGQVVAAEMDTETIDVSNLQQGMYIIKAVSADGLNVSTGRFVKVE